MNMDIDHCPLLLNNHHPLKLSPDCQQQHLDHPSKQQQEAAAHGEEMQHGEEVDQPEEMQHGEEVDRPEEKQQEEVQVLDPLSSPSSIHLLPPELKAQILFKLPIKCRILSGLVCKDWNSLLHSPWPSQLAYSDPWLVSLSEFGFTAYEFARGGHWFHLFHPFVEPPLEGTGLAASAGGLVSWLLNDSRGRDSKLLVFNPITQQSRLLPIPLVQVHALPGPPAHRARFRTRFEGLSMNSVANTYTITVRLKVGFFNTLIQTYDSNSRRWAKDSESYAFAYDQVPVFPAPPSNPEVLAVRRNVPVSLYEISMHRYWAQDPPDDGCIDKIHTLFFERDVMRTGLAVRKLCLFKCRGERILVGQLEDATTHYSQGFAVWKVKEEKRSEKPGTVQWVQVAITPTQILQAKRPANFEHASFHGNEECICMIGRFANTDTFRKPLGSIGNQEILDYMLMYNLRLNSWEWLPKPPKTHHTSVFILEPSVDAPV